MQKEITRLEGMLAGVTKKFANEKFINNALANIVKNEKNTVVKQKEMLAELA